MSGDPGGFYYCEIHGQYFPSMIGGGCPQCAHWSSPLIPIYPPFNPMDVTGLKIDMNQRKYLPTLSELIDRLTIVQQKELKIPEHREEYTRELEDLMHDIQMCLDQNETWETLSGQTHAQKTNAINAETIRNIIILTLMNCEIWHNETNFRKGIKDGNNLELTHGLNGIRNTAKNKIQERFGGRKDYKVDNVKAFEQWVPSGYKKEDDK